MALEILNTKVHLQKIASIDAIAAERKVKKSKIARLLIHKELESLGVQKPA